MSEPAPAQVEAPVPQDSATSVAAEPAAEGGAEGQSKKGAKKVRARSVNLEALIVTRGIGARSAAARAPRDPAIVPRDSSRTRRAHARRVPALARTPHSCARARPPARPPPKSSRPRRKSSGTFPSPRTHTNNPNPVADIPRPPDPSPETQAAKEAEKAALKAKKAAEVAARELAQQGGPDPLAHKYGDAPLIQSQARSGKVWTHVKKLDAPSSQYQTVLLRGRVHNVRGKGKSAFLVLRQQTATVQVTFFGEFLSIYTFFLSSVRAIELTTCFVYH
jgi:hypothetical protein